MRHEAEMKAILKQVELLTPEERQWLATKIVARDLSNNAEEAESFPQRVLSIDDLVGIGNPHGKTFTDEEIDAIRFEAVKEKYLK